MENGNGYHPPNGDGGEIERPEPILPILPIKSDARCKVCQNPNRRVIERLTIMPNVSYTEIAETFDVPRRSVSNHAKMHLNYEEAAVRRLIEQEASKLEEDVEEGVKGALSRRVFLSAYIQKSLEALLNNELELSGKEAMSAILLEEQITSASGGAAVDEIRMQFNAFVQAIREITQHDIEQLKSPQDLQSLILGRTQDILERYDHKQIEG